MESLNNVLERKINDNLTNVIMTKNGAPIENESTEGDENEKVSAKFKKSRSYIELSKMSSVQSMDVNERRVLVIYTGGTIGMVKNNNGGKYIVDFFCYNFVYVMVLIYIFFFFFNNTYTTEADSLTTAISQTNKYGVGHNWNLF